MEPDAFDALPGAEPVHRGLRRRAQRRRARHRARLGDRAQALRHPLAARRCCGPAERIAREGFVIDPTFNGQVTDNAAIFDDFTSTRELYLTPEKTAKPVGAVQTNPDLADDLQADRRRPGPLLPRADRARHRPDRAAPAGGGRLRSPARGAPGHDDPARPQAVRRDPPQADPGRLPRARRLRHGPAVLGRLDRRRGAQHPRGAARRTADRTRRCTATSRRPSSPTPTATRTSATRRTSTCRCAACCRTAFARDAARADRRRQRAPHAAARR